MRDDPSFLKLNFLNSYYKISSAFFATYFSAGFLSANSGNSCAVVNFRTIL